MRRVLAPAIAAIASILAATLVLDWFVASIGGGFEIDRITFDLREARACSNLGVCGVVPMSMVKGGLYTPLAQTAFWGSLLFVCIVAYQAGTKLLSGFVNETVSRAGYMIGSLVVLAAFGAGYLFGPDLGSASLMGLAIEVKRAWGPPAMLLGVVLGILALYYASGGGIDDTAVYKPVEIPRATARPATATTPPKPAEPVTAPAAPAKVPTAQQLPRRAAAPTTPPPAPAALKGKVQFAMVSGEVTVAGIDARREDGETILVLWRDVVGLVVRRLPAELEGHVFLDIVSTAGMTLRVVPWTKLTGEPIEGDGDARVRAFVELVKPRCPDAKLDRATQAFLDGAKPAAQLTLELLGKHDQALG